MLPAHIVGLLELPYKKEEVVMPAMSIYESGETEKYLFGVQAVLQGLVQKRLLPEDYVMRTAWSDSGIDWAKEHLKPVLDFLFHYPLVRLKVGL